MNLLELCACLRGLLEMGAITGKVAVDILIGRFALTRFGASLLLMEGTA